MLLRVHIDCTFNLVVPIWTIMVRYFWLVQVLYLSMYICSQQRMINQGISNLYVEVFDVLNYWICVRGQKVKYLCVFLCSIVSMAFTQN